MAEDDRGAIESLNALTLAVGDMARSVRFYEAVGFVLEYGGAEAAFTSFRCGADHLNLRLERNAEVRGDWGRAVFYASDVDALYDRVVAAGLQPEAPPRDAEWGERYFHLRDPDGHELSFARPLSS
jgi:catechol 2,3-dioxygenase-like lactoylglutathione lyase family enzyme